MGFLHKLWLRLTAPRYQPPAAHGLLQCLHVTWGPCAWQYGPLGFRKYQRCTTCGLYRLC